MRTSVPLPTSPRAALALTAILSLAGPARVAAQQEVPVSDEWRARAEEARNAPLFATDEPLAMTLSTRIDWLRDKRPDDEEAEGTVRYQGPDGPVEVPVEVRTRGNFRRDKRNCNFPPLRLDFPTKRVAGTVFEGQDKLKLVTPCHDSRDAYQQYVLQEYLAYRVYQLLTPFSFRVRLVEVTYEDTDGEYDTRTKVAFLIESDEQMATRNLSEVSEWEQFHPANLDPVAAVRTALFQYMIGNTDYSAPYFHNAVMVRTLDGRYVVVPYDFDFSGVVNARYASPDPSLPIRNVRQRLYRGFCRPEVDMEAVAQEFRDIRDDVRLLYENQPYLDDKQKKRALSYYDGFYEVLDNPRKFEREIVSACRRLPA